MTKAHNPRACTAVDRTIGKRLRKARNAAGLSQQALASKIGVTFQQVQKQEKGHNRIAASRLLAIAKAVDQPITYFFDGL